MDPTLLGTLISAALVALYHVLFTGKAPPSVSPSPIAPTPSPSPSPTPSPAAPGADPFAGLPGLPGHPLLNGLILPFLNSLLAGKQPTATIDVHSQAATAALASVIKSDAATLAQMQALLGQPVVAK